ncbi:MULTISPECIES: phage tail terminator family protein [Bacillaceae]|uniref:phage tail terminator family protein n=1 Tax=Bacillaceae TaxID=186817 RepID=UPI000BFCC34D|nr:MULTISPECIES: hypothetical protein [Bacillaceae]PGT89213.1 hypothetical protein COD11_04230 [Bacillus sp. AFS040349]UGB31706.1 hypothetical protein LPC09_04280 [Metabacillus sp. B2-18]
MILDIRENIIKTLKTNFQNHKIYGEKKTQGLTRPCFFVDILPIDAQKITPNMQEKSYIVDVQYMSLEDTKLKNLEMSEKISQLFTHVIGTGGKRISVTNERFEIIDGILHYLFDIDFILIGKQTDEHELMKNINLNREVFTWDFHE